MEEEKKEQLIKDYTKQHYNMTHDEIVKKLNETYSPCSWSSYGPYRYGSYDEQNDRYIVDGCNSLPIELGNVIDKLYYKDLDNSIHKVTADQFLFFNEDIEDKTLKNIRNNIPKDEQDTYNKNGDFFDQMRNVYNLFKGKAVFTKDQETNQWSIVLNNDITLYGVFPDLLSILKVHDGKNIVPLMKKDGSLDMSKLSYIFEDGSSIISSLSTKGFFNNINRFFINKSINIGKAIDKVGDFIMKNNDPKPPSLN